MAGRPPTPICTYGKVSNRELAEDLREARTYFRDYDGSSRLVSRRGRSGPAAQRALTKALIERARTRSPELDRNTRLRVVAERWFSEVEEAVAADDLSPNTSRLYHCYLDLHILPAVGDLRISEADVPDWTFSCGRSRSAPAHRSRRPVVASCQD
jgi:hypothetical protein